MAYMHIKIENQLNILNLNKFSPKGDHYSQFTHCESYELCAFGRLRLTVTLITHWILIHLKMDSFSYFSCTLFHEWIKGGLAILRILGQSHMGLHLPEDPLGQERSISFPMFPKLRERPKGHILRLEVLKFCFPQPPKIYAFWYCS